MELELGSWTHPKERRGCQLHVCLCSTRLSLKAAIFSASLGSQTEARCPASRRPLARLRSVRCCLQESSEPASRKQKKSQPRVKSSAGHASRFLVQEQEASRISPVCSQLSQAYQMELLRFSGEGVFAVGMAFGTGRGSYFRRFAFNTGRSFAWRCSIRNLPMSPQTRPYPSNLPKPPQNPQNPKKWRRFVELGGVGG